MSDIKWIAFGELRLKESNIDHFQIFTEEKKITLTHHLGMEYRESTLEFSSDQSLFLFLDSLDHKIGVK